MLSFQANMKGNHMLNWSIIFLIIAIVAGVFGFGGIASASVGIAQTLFFIFVVLFLITLVSRFLNR